ncbi:MAG TPA: hypothetical protein VGK78_19570 [Nocardioides sp.]|uniref:hypothetical protein n=1 Tax=Nocardioides sp. TaxID=35761 RepID=UPI002F417111
MRVWTRYAATAALVLTATTGCGGGSDSGGAAHARPFSEQSVGAVLKAARADMRSLKAARITGTTTGSNGQQEILDIQADRRGHCRGTITESGIGGATFLATNGKVWLKGDVAYLAEQMSSYARAESILRRMHNRWLEVDGGEIGSWCDLDHYVSSNEKLIRSHNREVKGVGEVAGEKAVLVASHKDGNQLTVWVAETSPHYFLRVALSDQAGSDLVAVSFSKFDEPLEVEAPPPSQVLRIGGSRA